MESEEELKKALELYQSQLDEVRRALSKAEGDERGELESLEASVSELVELTKESLASQYPQQPPQQSPQQPPSALDAEYALFKAELAELNTEEEEQEVPSSSTCSNQLNPTDIQEELDELVGSKCQAPYTNKLEVTHYYNALVLSTHVAETASDLQHIQVRVMFTNPVEKEMIPCRYYLDGDCKFSDNKCNFSHGYLVLLSQLREYREPEFEDVKAGCVVLAKLPGSELWVSTRIQDVLSLDTVSVKHAGKSIHVPLHDVLPLASSSVHRDEAWSDEEEEAEEGEESVRQELWSEAAVERSLLGTPSAQRIGHWEQHTKGIGSKLMAKMGYVVGAGLGRHGEGRLEPVEAVVLPPGRSLDHCMRLKEEAGGSKDLFSVERLQKKLAAKAQRRSAQIYRNKAQQDRNNVFTIINSMTANTQEPKGEDVSSRGFKKELEGRSERWLNVERVKTEEMMEKIGYEVQELGLKLTTRAEGSAQQRHEASKLANAKSQLETLSKKHFKLSWEIKARETKKKMAF